MKIGDKVRFLSEVGGGKISGFQGKNTVLVEDEDGFEIPMPLSEVVVIDTDDYNMAKVNTRSTTKESAKAEMTDAKHGIAKPQKVWDEEEEEEIEPCDRPITFKAAPKERKEGDVLALSLCFVPVDVKRISTTSFKVYVVNESNYYVQALLLQADGAKWQLYFNGVVAPNSHVYVDEIDRTMLNDWEHLCVQTLAWKEDKAFTIKPATSTQIKLDCTKFYKLHTFQPNAFFNTPNWAVSILFNDKSVRGLYVDAEELKTALTEKEPKGKTNGNGDGKMPKAKKTDAIIEVDLHINELLDTTSGMNNADILAVQMGEFRKVMDEHSKKPGQKIVFIHGKGNGVLRKAILDELKYRYKQCTWQDASFREYGFGATQVTIHR